MELLTFAIAASETKIFKRAGRYFEIIDAAYALGVDFYDENGGKADGMIGALSGLFVSGPFTEFSVSNGAIPQTVTLMIHEGQGGSRRQPGVVRVVDQGAEKTLAGMQFMTQATLAAQAAACSVVGIRSVNKTVAVKSIKIGSPVAGEIYLGTFTGPPTVRNYDVPAPSKLIGAAGSDGSVFASTIAASNGAPTVAEGPGYALLGRTYLAANGSADFLPSTPILLRPGYCLIVNGGMYNRQVTAVLDLEEL